ncbi:hypothetical protein [Enterobacter ludwigii]|nr:hypothetical protein ABR36_10025 [Enterobacter ludwigii]
MFTPYRWDPTGAETYSNANGSQVLKQDAASFSLTANATAGIDAPGETLVLRTVSFGRIQWDGVALIYAGTFQIDCSRDGSDFYLGNKDGKGSGVLAVENQGRFEVLRPGRVLLNGKLLRLQDNGEMTIAGCGDGIFMVDDISIENNARLQLSTNKLVTMAEDSTDSFLVTGNALLNISVDTEFHVNVSVADNGRAFVYVGNVEFNQGCSFTLAGNSEVFVGGQSSSPTVLSHSSPVGAGGFNFITKGGNTSVLILDAMMGDPNGNIPLTTPASANLLVLFDMLLIDGIAAKDINKFNVDLDSSPGQMLISLK